MSEVSISVAWVFNTFYLMLKKERNKALGV